MGRVVWEKEQKNIVGKIAKLTLVLIVGDSSLKLFKELFSPLGEIRTLPGREMSPEKIGNADILLVRSITAVNRALLNGTSVRWAGTASAGFDNIDQKELKEMGIAWSSAPGCNADGVADHILCLCAEALYEGLLSPGDAVGVVGVGEVGKRVVQRLPALQLQPIPYDPPRAEREANRELANIDQLRSAKMVTLHVPLSRSGKYQTEKMVTAEWLSRFTNLKMFVNSSRGGVVEKSTLFTLVDRGVAVALDVWPDEPIIDRSLLKCVRWATPHIAGHSRMGKLRGTLMLYNAYHEWVGLPNRAHEEEWKEKITLSVAPDSTPVDWIRKISWLKRDDAALRKAVAMQSSDVPFSFDLLRDSYPERVEFSEVKLIGLKTEEQLHSASILGFASP